VTLVIEDGSIVTGANSYVDDAEYVAYALARGKTIGSDATAREIELILAMDYIESFRDQFKGVKVQFDQPLQWPRSGVYIDGYIVDFDSIPQELKDAQMEAGIVGNSTNLLKSGTNQNIAKEKLGDMEIEYFNGGSWESVQTDNIDAKFNVLLSNSGFGINANAFRA